MAKDESSNLGPLDVLTFFAEPQRLARRTRTIAHTTLFAAHDNITGARELNPACACQSRRMGI